MRQNAEISLRVEDDSMMDYGIRANDTVVADPSSQPSDGEIVLAMLNGQVLLRKYFNIDKKICLAPENVNYPTIELKVADEFEVIGVIKKIINNAQ